MLQLLYLMDAVQNGIRQQNLRFTFSLTLYIARVAQQMLKPGTVTYCTCWISGMLKRRVGGCAWSDVLGWRWRLSYCESGSSHEACFPVFLRKAFSVCLDCLTAGRLGSDFLLRPLKMATLPPWNFGVEIIKGLYKWRSVCPVQQIRVSWPE